MKFLRTILLILLLLVPIMSRAQTGTTISGQGSSPNGRIFINPTGQGTVVLGGPWTRDTYSLDIQGSPIIGTGDSQLNVQSNSSTGISMGAITISNNPGSVERTLYITVGDANANPLGHNWVKPNAAVLGTTINTPLVISVNDLLNNGISIALDGVVTVDKSLRVAEIGSTGTKLTLRGNPAGAMRWEIDSNVGFSFLNGIVTMDNSLRVPEIGGTATKLTLRGNPIGGMRWEVDSNVGFSFLNGNIFANQLGTAGVGSLPLCYEPATGAIRVGSTTGCP